jgi:hypothetical protein
MKLKKKSIKRGPKKTIWFNMLNSQSNSQDRDNLKESKSKQVTKFNFQSA